LPQTGEVEFHYKKSATVALHNDRLQNAQVVFNYTKDARVYNKCLGTCASSTRDYP